MAGTPWRVPDATVAADDDGPGAGPGPAPAAVPPPPPPAGTHSGRRTRLRIAALAAGAALLIAGVAWAGVSRLGSDDPPESQAGTTASASPAPRASQGGKRPKPHTTWPTFTAAPGVTFADRAETPATLHVPALGVSTAPEPVGRTGGELTIPHSATTVVWWAYGAAPGDRTGTVVMAGHIDWNGREGLLGRLGTMKKGQPVRVVRHDGRTVTYRVTSVERVHKTRLSTLGLFTTDGPAELALVTCGGAYDPVHHTFQDNVVVRAVPTHGPKN